WYVACERDMRGYNVVVFDNQGRPTRLNSALIPCKACVIGSASYTYLLPKHKSGRNIYIESIAANGASLGYAGPAVKQ
ncbi:MAG TPA: hypothetical protein VFT43_09660, partial [Candidatus Polarisedimenticolia bacterium]|nr:hypothetical protein [Candidatus Polarisedimenticolia bacterium]